MSRVALRHPLSSILAAFAVVVTGGLAQAQDAATPMTGTQIAEQVNMALAENGQSGNALIAATRRYFPCDGALRVTPRRDGRWDAVDVKCDTPLHWNIVVRTSAVGGDAGVADGEDEPEIRTAVVLRHSARKGEVLTEDHLELRDFEKALAPGTYGDLQELVGRRMDQSLGAGVPIRERHLERDWAVVEGTPVMIEMNVGGLTVSAGGEALDNGQVGDSVSVRNLRSGKIVRGFVTGEKKVSLGPNMN